MQNGIEWFYCKLYSSWDITIFPSSSRHCFQIRPWLLDRYNHKCSARPPEETGKARNVQIVLFRPFNVNEEWHWIFFRLILPFRSYYGFIMKVTLLFSDLNLKMRSRIWKWNGLCVRIIHCCCKTIVCLDFAFSVCISACNLIFLCEHTQIGLKYKHHLPQTVESVQRLLVFNLNYNSALISWWRVNITKESWPRCLLN